MLVSTHIRRQLFFFKSMTHDNLIQDLNFKGGPFEKS